MGLRPTYEDENGFYSATPLTGSAALPFCHLDRSVAERRDLCVDASSWKCFSMERNRPVPPGSAVFSGQSFDFDPAEPYLCEFYFDGDFSAC
ncbi:MAG: hypothetical protein QOH35_103 [Acidobacteriaceae bacterium]|nr:hypothetical protein [Acidobacteriaceae bacterium]